MNYFTDSETMTRPSYKSNRKLTLLRSNPDRGRGYERSISAVERLGLSTPPPTLSRDRERERGSTRPRPLLATRCHACCLKVSAFDLITCCVITGPY